MLRGPDGILQSLHAFRHNKDDEHADAFRLPVLIHPSPSRIREGGGDDSAGTSCTPARWWRWASNWMHCAGCRSSPCRSGSPTNSRPRDREPRLRVPKLPVGCTQGGGWHWSPALVRMDIVHSGYNIQALLNPRNATLVRVCIQGPLRRTKNRFIQDILGDPPHGRRIQRVLDIGGGQGGDCHHWVRTPGIERVDVVDVDRNALDEFGRRLVTSYQAKETEGGQWLRPVRAHRVVGLVRTLPGGRRIVLHHDNARHMHPSLGIGADLALLDFSVTQIVSGPHEVRSFLHDLLVVRRVPCARGPPDRRPPFPLPSWPTTWPSPGCRVTSPGWPVAWSSDRRVRPPPCPGRTTPWGAGWSA